MYWTKGNVYKFCPLLNMSYFCVPFFLCFNIYSLYKSMVYFNKRMLNYYFTQKTSWFITEYLSSRKSWVQSMTPLYLSFKKIKNLMCYALLIRGSLSSWGGVLKWNSPFPNILNFKLIVAITDFLHGPTDLHSSLSPPRLSECWTNSSWLIFLKINLI